MSTKTVYDEVCAVDTVVIHSGGESELMSPVL